MATILPRLSNEWIVSLDIRLHTPLSQVTVRAEKDFTTLFKSFFDILFVIFCSKTKIINLKNGLSFCSRAKCLDRETSQEGEKVLQERHSLDIHTTVYMSSYLKVKKGKIGAKGEAKMNLWKEK